MKSTLILASAILICLVGSQVTAQVTARRADTTSQSHAGENEKPKNAVEQTLEALRQKGEVVLERCLEDCGDAPVSDDVVNGRALELPVPSYPAIAKAAHATGNVEVQIIIDVDGSVIAAAAVSGHPLLQAAAVDAARRARFSTTTINGEPVKVTGLLNYSFMTR